MTSPLLRDRTRPEPINSDAAKVFNKGIKIDLPSMPPNLVHSKSPLPVATSSRILGLIRLSGTDMTGTRHGKVTCVGLAKDIPNRWVVRCDCGAYEIRKAAVLRREGIEEDACFECKRLLSVLACRQRRAAERANKIPS